MGFLKSIFRFLKICNKASKEVSKEIEKGLDDFSDYIEQCKIEQAINHEKEINRLKDKMKKNVEKYNRENNTNFKDHDELSAHLKALCDEKIRLMDQFIDRAF